MAFKAGAIVGTASLNTKQWQGGLGRMVKGVGIAAAAITAAFGAAMAKAVKSANEFQIAMANVSTIVDTSNTDMQALATTVLTELDPALGDATEITQGLYQAFSAGAADAEEAMEITTNAAIFAKAALTDTFTAVDVLTTAVNAYGKEVMTTEQASDLFFNTIKFGKVTGDELAATIGQSIPLFASAGIGLDELTAGMAAMTKQGVNAANATTQLNAIVNAFLKPSEEMKNLLAQVGAESGAAFLEAEGLAGALRLVEEATAGDAGEMSKLIPNIRGLRGVMALTGVGGEEFTRVLEAQGDAVGVTAEAFEKQEKTFDTFRNSAKNLQVVVGNIGKHFVDQIAVGATTATQSMIQFLVSSQGMEIVSNIIGGLAGAWELLKTIVEPIISAMRDVWGGVFDTIAEALADITGESTGGAGALKLLSLVVNTSITAMTVFGKIIQGVIRLIADLVIAIKESVDAVANFGAVIKGEMTAREFFAGFKGAGDAFKDLGVNFVDSVSEIYTTVKDEMQTFAGDTEELTSDLNANISTSFQNTRDNVQANWGAMITGQDSLVEAINAAQGQIQGAIAETNDDVETDTTESIYNMEATWEDYFDTIHEGFSSTFSGIANVTDQFYQNQLDSLDANLARQIEVLQDRRDAGIITEEEFVAQKEALENAAAEKANEISEKQFESQKRFQTAQVWIDTASAIVGWWRAATRLGPIAGPIFGGIMTAASIALAAAQTAAIAGQTFVPARQQGGMAGGLTRINERGGEIVSLPDGSQVVPADISNQIAANAAPQNIINVSFNGAKISDDMDLQRVTDHVVRQLGKELRLRA